MESIRELAKEYVELCKQAEIRAEKIAQWIVKTCRPVIEDLEYSIKWAEKYQIGWTKCGIDTIYFYSNSRNFIASQTNKIIGNIAFVGLIEEIIPEIEFHIDTPMGLFLTKEEAEKIKKLLSKKLKK